MKKTAFIVCCIALLVGISCQLRPEPSSGNKSISEIARLLSPSPQGIGVTYQNRVFWDQFLTDPQALQLLEEADTLYLNGIPSFVDSLYLDLLSSGIRLPGENMMNARFEYLYKLCIAECLSNQGKFIPAIEEALIEICTQNPWSIPAHDKDLSNYNGTNYYVDLVVATFGNSLAQCIYMLDDKISEQTLEIVMQAVREKIFDPIRRCIETDSLFYWFTVKNNWNSVCLAGVTGAALTLLKEKEERAFFIHVAEKYYSYGLEGYGDDGYCSEGVGYYNYGFRALILLREHICRATNGEIDLLATPKFARIAQYGKNIQIINKVCPTYSDCRIGLSPDWFIINYCDNALGTKSYYEKYSFPQFNNLALYLIEFFPEQAWKIASSPEIEAVIQLPDNHLRSYFEVSDVVICRPSPDSSHQLGVSFKGGNNAENHNHNDIGSYVVALGNETMAGDQGGPFSYPGDFWSKGAYQKYKSKGSYGHPVPLINDSTQVPGKEAQASLVKKEFTESSDFYQIEYACAYRIPELKKLTRIFNYNREEESSFRVEDSFESLAVCKFETAITTRAQWKIENNTIELTSGKEKLQIWVEASGPVSYTHETIAENAPAYTRLGIELKEKTQTGYIRLTMKPIN